VLVALLALVASLVSAPAPGAHAQDRAAHYAGVPLIVTSTCTDPQGWCNIHTLAFRLVMEQESSAGLSYALWVEYDEEANQVRFYDPATGEFQTGTPGEAKLLQNEWVTLDLARTTVGAIDAEKKTVQIHWALTFRKQASSQTFKQLLQVQRDASAMPAWDEVGTLQVATGAPSIFLPMVQK
jgi:hypothetical protein